MLKFFKDLLLSWKKKSLLKKKRNGKSDPFIY